MQTFHLIVDEDGRVTIPGTRPGENVTVQLIDTADLPTVSTDGERAGPIPEEERAAIKTRVQQLAREIRAELPEPWLSTPHGDLLYDENGLPK